MHLDVSTPQRLNSLTYSGQQRLVLHLDLSTLQGHDLHAPRRVRTTGVFAASVRIYIELHLNILDKCSWTFLHYRDMNCAWTCLHLEVSLANGSLSCTNRLVCTKGLLNILSRLQHVQIKLQHARTGCNIILQHARTDGNM